MRRGEIWRAEFDFSDEGKSGFIRPVLIVQDNSFNDSSIKTILVLPMTPNLYLLDAPGNVLVHRRESRLADDSVIIVSNLYAIERGRLKEKISKIDKLTMRQVEIGMKLVLGINK
ncbi:MAG: type II toxin-antitoxin system PemK/MazF family toxin [Spirochaetes bacterium]|nr:type II toxin-antitoxin system PemK/MazF family toxin [Spirochaetota bacterium]